MVEKIILHHCHQARSMRTLWLLMELELDFELKVYEFGKELRSPQYLAKHPLGRVPCIELDGKIMFETGAIGQYLTELFPQKGLGRNPGNKERPEFLQWLHYGETIGVHGATLTQQHIVIFEDKDRSPLLMKLERRRMEKTLEVLDNHLSDGRNYLLASGFSLADIQIGYSLYISRFFTPLETFSSLNAYYQRLNSRPAFIQSLPDSPAIYQKDFYPLPGEPAS